MTSPFLAQHSIPIKESKTLKLSGIFTSTDRKYFHNCSVCATLRAHVTNLYLTNMSLHSSVNPSWHQTLFLFSRAFALGRRTESEVRADRNDGGANRAGAARTFKDAVVACDRLTRTVVVGSVKRVAEEVVEWGDPVPEHTQHLRVLVHCASLEPSQYRECYRAWRRHRGETGFCPRGQIREDTRGQVTRIRIGYSHADRLLTYPRVHNLSAISLPIRVINPEAGRAYWEQHE